MVRRPAKRRERRLRAEPIDRAAAAQRAIELFNGGAFWEAHEALETLWRSQPDHGVALVLQGLIQAAAALLHRERGNQHGVSVVGEAALDKLKGPQHPAIEFETEQFYRDLAQALRQGGPAPRLLLKDT